MPITTSITTLEGYCEALQQELQGAWLTILWPDPVPQFLNEGMASGLNTPDVSMASCDKVVTGVEKCILLDLCLLCLADHLPLLLQGPWDGANIIGQVVFHTNVWPFCRVSQKSHLSSFHQSVQCLWATGERGPLPRPMIF